MNHQFSLRAGALRDAAQIRRAFLEVGWTDEAAIPDANLTMAFQESAIVVSAWLATELCGFVRVKNDGMYAYLSNLVVRPRYQGAGLGRALFAEGVQQARQIPGKFAVVGIGRAGQEDFYAAHGLRRPDATIVISDVTNL